MPASLRKNNTKQARQQLLHLAKAIASRTNNHTSFTFGGAKNFSSRPSLRSKLFPKLTVNTPRQQIKAPTPLRHTLSTLCPPSVQVHRQNTQRFFFSLAGAKRLTATCMFDRPPSREDLYSRPQTKADHLLTSSSGNDRSPCHRRREQREPSRPLPLLWGDRIPTTYTVLRIPPTAAVYVYESGSGIDAGGEIDTIPPPFCSSHPPPRSHPSYGRPSPTDSSRSLKSHPGRHTTPQDPPLLEGEQHKTKQEKTGRRSEKRKRKAWGMRKRRRKKAKCGVGRG